MSVLVTGGTGFIGSHLVRALLARGDRVRCLVRPTSSLSNLEGLDVEPVEGDLRRPSSLVPAVRGCRAVYHCAADYRLYARDPGEIYAANVDGTRAILQVAGDEGVERVVYTSSVGALGLESDRSPANESTAVDLGSMIGHYKRSKFLAERVAEEVAAAGLGVVIVNPSTPVGELDLKPTPTGRLILDFLNRRLPAYTDTGLNLVDVRDVAAGHLLAEERGRVGEKYILGNRNMSLKEILETLSRLTGLPAPRLRLPHWVPLVAATVSTGLARLTRTEPAVSLESVRMSKHHMYFSSRRAIDELGLPQTPVEDALERATSWFRLSGYVSGT